MVAYSVRTRKEEKEPDSLMFLDAANLLSLSCFVRSSEAKSFFPQ